MITRLIFILLLIASSAEAQSTRILDSSGTLISPSTSALQSTGNTSLSSIDGKITAVNTGAVVISSGTLTCNAGTNLNTSALALETGGNLASIAGKDFATQTTLALIKAKTDNLDVALSTRTKPADSQTVTGTVTANMGTVTADPFGANADAASATGSISAKLRFIAGTGIPITGTVTVGSHAVTNAGTFAVQATEADGANATLGAKADAKSTATDTTAITIMQVLKQISASAQAPPSQAVTNAGTFATQDTQAGTWTVQPGNTANTTPWLVSIVPATAGGWSVGNFTSGDTFAALTNTAQVIKGSAGQFGGYYFSNTNATTECITIYDVAAASVTVGTTTPKLNFVVPAGAAANIEIAQGVPFGTAMSIAAATTCGGNTAPTTALDVMAYYK